MKDPRAASRYSKPNCSEVDKELQNFLDSHMVTTFWPTMSVLSKVTAFYLLMN
jgi:hypothetical protein